MTEPDYFTTAELRALPDMADTTLYPASRALAAAAWAVGIIEREVGTSFIGRSRTETYDGADADGYGLVLREPYVLSVTSVTEGGTLVTPVPVIVNDSGILSKFAVGATSPSAWTWGHSNIVVTYVGGYSATPPADIKEAALQATRARLLATNSRAGQNQRRRTLTTEAGTFELATAGENAPTGFPEVDAVILGWKARIDVLGFA